ncbi:MAG: efflux RND transporter periplasmic adaptor subunit [Acidobacteria bacterium]|nr:MAG: efflux RND transporter periplasmic adaptor subunit [Acidobacteriota bacterium]
MKTKLILPLVILLLSAAGTLALVRSRKPVETRPDVPQTPLVRVVVAERQDVPLDVHAQGTVLPRTETTLVAQVAGQVIAVSESFVSGGFFARGELLVKLDPRDHELALRRAEAQVAQAELRLTQERAEAQVAREEWQALGGREAFGADPDPLVLRQPQIAQLEATLAAARAEVEQARLNLERTEIRAPFAGRLRSKLVDVGAYLMPGSPVATIHAIDYAEVKLPVADDELAFLELPVAYRDGAAGPRPEVTLSARFAGRSHSWSGRIVRSEGELDPRSRMLNLVARIEDPYGRSGRPPLVVGQFVDAIIAGRVAEGVFVLPRAALRRGEEDHVLVVGDDERLRKRPVEVVRIAGETVIVGRGLEEGERVCLSNLEVVVDGMPVRVVEEEQPAVGAPAEDRS